MYRRRTLLIRKYANAPDAQVVPSRLVRPLRRWATKTETTREWVDSKVVAHQH